MHAWSVLVSADRFAAERLYHHEVLELDGMPGASQIEPGDRVALVADVQPRVVFALGRAEELALGKDEHRGEDTDRTLVLAYTHRFFDAPRPATALQPDDHSIHRLTPATLDGLTPGSGEQVQRTWLVSLDLPIEAASAAEAVRQFWTYVRELGPAELPAFVSPTNDELAMQAFVLGEQANLDPEEDD